jgi:L-gulonate 3-dehydrogenase
LTTPTRHTVAVVGTGVIGRSWIRVFARAGCDTRMFDPDVARRDEALAWAEASVREDERLGFCDAGAAAVERGRIRACATIDEALEGATWVQENGPEPIESKRSIYADLDEHAEAAAILASSTSAQDMSRIAEGLTGAHRCIVAHPVNPPHVIPAVEVVPGRETSADTLAAALAFLRSVGQAPVQMNRYLPGFLLNRLQAALVREAISLIGSGAASADAIDSVVRDGLGLRWALMGPFGTGHTNADGGVGEYLRRYGEAYRSLWADLDADPILSASIIDRVHRETEAIYGEDRARTLAAWRDRMVRKIRDAKADDPPPTA